jgi:hypothetical protein
VCFCVPWQFALPQRITSPVAMLVLPKAGDYFPHLFPPPPPRPCTSHAVVPRVFAPSLEALLLLLLLLLAGATAHASW